MFVGSRIQQPKALVVDESIETLATVKLCLMTLQLHRFVGCQFDKDCFKECVQVLVGTYVRQGLVPESNITVSEELVNALKEMFRAIDGVEEGRKVGK